MPGPAPKPPGQRRRRNKGPKAQSLPPPSSARKAPVLPGSSKLLPATRQWWRTVWGSPMAGVYLDADVPTLVRLAGLVDRVGRGDQAYRLPSEIRALEDRFGLSPLARRRLQWEVEQATEQPDEHEGGDDRWLRAVSD